MNANPIHDRCHIARRSTDGLVGGGINIQQPERVLFTAKLLGTLMVAR